MTLGYARTLLKLFTSTGSRGRKPATLNYVLKHYPRVYKLIMETIARGECPLCGRALSKRFALATHVKGRLCSNLWMELARSMYGKNRKSEEEVLELINRMRERFGAPPLDVMVE